MTAITFTPTVNPAFPLELKEKVRLSEIKFGGGYSQRATEGMNDIEGFLTVIWENITTAEKEGILTFLRDRNGTEPFYPSFFTDIGAIYICPEWSSTRIASDTFSIHANFIRVFDL